MDIFRCFEFCVRVLLRDGCDEDEAREFVATTHEQLQDKATQSVTKTKMFLAMTSSRECKMLVV